jgi:hypothetical protein
MFTRQISVLLLILATTLPAQTSRIDTTRPAIPLPKFLGQVGAGIVGAGFGFGLVGGGYLALSRSPVDPSIGVMGTMALGTVVGMPLGSAAGVHLAGSRGDKTGSFIASTMTSALGMYLGGSLLSALHVPVVISLPLSAGLGAAAGFNLTRHYKKVPARIDTSRSSPPALVAPYPITGRPPVTLPRIVTEWAAAFILAHYGGSIGSNLAFPGYVSDPYGSLSDLRILAGIASGIQIGSLIGVKVVASEANQTASFPATLAGGLAGFALGAAVTNYTENPEYLFAGSATGSVIGFNLTRRYVPIPYSALRAH